MMSKKALPVLVIVVFVGILSAVSCKGRGNNENDTLARQQQLLAAIGMIIEQRHYSPKAIDDEFSQKVFTNYIKQLDGDKDVLLQSDIDSLSIFKTLIDDEIHAREPMMFFPTALDMFKRRIKQVAGIYQGILSRPFSFNEQESVQLNGDSLDFPRTEADRQDIWRRRMKYQTLVRFVDLQSQRDKAKVGDSIKLKTDSTLEVEARTAVRRMMDRSFNRFNKVTNEEDQFAQFVNVIADLMDPHTDYQPPVDKREFDEEMSNKFYGIGAQLGNTDENIKIVSLITGSPAWKSGKIQVNDLIVKVGEKGKPPVDISGYETTDAVKLIRGNKGTEVHLTIKKALDNSLEEVVLIRDEIKQDEASARSAVITKNGKKMGYIYLPEFYADFNDPNGARCAVDVANEIKKLKNENIQGLILDLRTNGGGSLYDVVQMVGLFVKGGPVVQVRDRDGKSQQLKDEDQSVLYSGPLTVMINEFSASASEIFAAAIQDYGRGVIIGSDSYGKGTVQKQLPLGKADEYGMPEYGALKLTFEKFYRINGGSTQMKGVTPDVVIPDLFEYLHMREKDNPSALPWDKIAAASYTPWVNDFNFQSVVDKARLRVQSNPSFNAIRANTTWLSQNVNLPVSLNVADYKAWQKTIKSLTNRDDSVMKLKVPLTVNPAVVDNDLFFKNKDEAKGERYKQWLKLLKTDMYINEAVNILRDADSAVPNPVHFAPKTMVMPGKKANR